MEATEEWRRPFSRFLFRLFWVFCPGPLFLLVADKPALWRHRSNFPLTRLATGASVKQWIL